MGRELTIQDGAWLVRRDKKHPLYAYCIEKAPSNRSKCNKCGDTIDKGALRVGKPMNDPRGTYGIISAWQHVSCTYLPEAQDKGFSAQICGISELSSTERRGLLRDLAEKPSHLDSVDPETCVVQRDLDEREPPEELTRTLFPFQKKGFGWLVDQEKAFDADEEAGRRPFCAGGILADEMGMGKTIQMISLILERKGNGPTLVITPVSSMLQWKEEIESYVEPNALSVGVFHGPTTKMNIAQLRAYDIVLTTYQTVEKQWQKLISSKKIVCDNCGKHLLPRKLHVHQKYFCGATAERTMKQKKQEKKQSYETIAKGLSTLKVIQNRMESEDAVKFDSATDTGAGALEKPSGEIDPVNIRSVTPWRIFNELTGQAETAPVKLEPNTTELPKTANRRKRKVAVKTESERNESEETKQPNAPSTEVKQENTQESILLSPPRAICTDSKAELDHRDIEGYESSSLDFSLSPMHDIDWYRIVLDEAHRIKSKNTSTSRGVYALKGKYKWCVTGTPLQNRVGDMYSLIRFLRLEKFSRYFCQNKGCECNSLSYPFTVENHRKCIYCKHSPLVHFNYFNKHVLNPICRYGYVGCGRQAMLLLKESILDRVMLRRKKDRVDDLNLPALSVRFAHVDLKSDEKDFYEALYKQSEAKFDSFVQKGTLLNNYAHIFDLLSSLRQALDHPFLVLHRPSLDDIDTGTETRLKSADVCTICHDAIATKKVVHTKPCMHTFHKTCMAVYIQNFPGDTFGCPRCFTPLTIDINALRSVADDSDDDESVPSRKSVKKEEEDTSDVEDFLPAPPADNLVNSQAKPNSSARAKPKKAVGRRNIIQRIDVSAFKTSSKLEAIIDFIRTIPLDDKVIIFSQYASMLDLIEWRLEKEEYKTAKLLGSMPLVMRRSMLRIFRRETNDVRIMLISLRAGGEGLNLQIANHILLVDPWWNPAVELQAIQRAHRIGQTKPVFATRFICRDTIEERMIELQGKKMLVFEGAIDSDQCSMTKLTQEDMQFLFAR